MRSCCANRQKTSTRVPVAHLRVAAKVDDDAHEDEADERDDLDTAEPELEFTEHPDAKEVDSKD